MDVAAPHQCHRETGTCVTPVSKMRLQTANMCCHAAEMHLGSTGDKMETASADHLTLHEGDMEMHVRMYWGELMCLNLHQADSSYSNHIKQEAISSPNMWFSACLFKCQVCACFACMNTSAWVRLHSCCIRSAAWKTPQQQALCAECIHLHYTIIKSKTKLYDKKNRSRETKAAKQRNKTWMFTSWCSSSGIFNMEDGFPWMICLTKDRREKKDN